jgi:hypothetical protein
MSAGYQRLLTFEHAGGGYSWFGEQDPAPYLSVTAFGLMEFADMAQVQTVDEKLDAYPLGIIANAFVMAAPTDPTTAQVMTMLLDLKKVDGDKVSWDSRT